MFVFLRSFQLGGDLGPNFALTADVGSVSPSSVTKSELFAGINVEVNDEATKITVTSVGICSNYVVVDIVNNCVGGATPTATPTLTPAATPTATPTLTPTVTPTATSTFFSIYTPIREENFTRSLIENLTSLGVEETFEIPIFDRLINFEIKSKQIAEDDGTVFIVCLQSEEETEEEIEDSYLAVISKRALDNSLTMDIQKTKNQDTFLMYRSYSGIETGKLKEFETSRLSRACDFKN
jgi:hypothetical protein